MLRFNKSAAARKLITKTTAAVTAFFVLSAPLNIFADVLGTHTSHKETQLAQGTILNINTFQNSDVGQQTEHFVTYTPNSDVVPILANGYSIYGKRTITQANDLLRGDGIYTAAGINADFFSFQTGVPMSNIIINGKVLSKDSANLPAIGFRSDGTAFMGNLPIETTMQTDSGTAVIECINKYRQPYALYLFTNEFSDSTHSPGYGINIVLGSVSGSFTLGSSVTAVVESISEDDGSVSIPQGKLVLSVASDASQELKDRLNILQVGTKVTFNTRELSGDERWNSAVYALGGLGGKLITNGSLDYSDESAAPRTAVGILADGSTVFYTIDGRQSGYSYGVRKETLARRLLELGCVEAMNLDGGGSTAIGGVLPGTTDFRVLNSPSDKGLRSCANFFFLKKNNAPSGIPYKLNLSDWGTPVLSGSSIQLRVESALDSSFGPADMPNDITFYLEQDSGTPSADGQSSVVYENGYVTVRGNGDVYVGAKSGSGASGSTMLKSVATPTELKIHNSTTGSEVTELSVIPGESVDLTGTAYWYGQQMVVADDSFTWRLVSDSDFIGEITNDGRFTASKNSGASGILAVNAGLCTYEIPVKIVDSEQVNTPAAYPQITNIKTSEGFSAEISSSNAVLTADNINLYIDGEPAAFEYNANTGTVLHKLSAEELSTYHRILLIVTDSTGASAMKACDIGKLSDNKNKFTDTEGHWASSYISYMAAKGVVNGSTDGDGTILFLPNNNMTRTEFAIMLCNYLGVNPSDYESTYIPFTDAGDIPWWAVNYVKAIYSLGIMQGQLTDYGVKFNPNSNIQRLEYAISIERLFPKGLAKSPITAADAADIPWWAMESMKLSTAQGILNGYPDGTLKPKQSVTRAEAVKILYTVFGAGK